MTVSCEKGVLRLHLDYSWCPPLSGQAFTGLPTNGLLHYTIYMKVRPCWGVYDDRDITTDQRYSHYFSGSTSNHIELSTIHLKGKRIAWHSPFIAHTLGHKLCISHLIIFAARNNRKLCECEKERGENIKCSWRTCEQRNIFTMYLCFERA
jgi:hypothetical protein